MDMKNAQRLGKLGGMAAYRNEGKTPIGKKTGGERPYIRPVTIRGLFYGSKKEGTVQTGETGTSDGPIGAQGIVGPHKAQRTYPTDEKAIVVGDLPPGPFVPNKQLREQKKQAAIPAKLPPLRLVLLGRRNGANVRGKSRMACMQKQQGAWSL